MADIAILIAEEYERRVRISRKSGQEIELMSCVGFLGQQLKGSSSSWMREKLSNFKEERFEIKGVSEPKYQLSLAASNGFFSA